MEISMENNFLELTEAESLSVDGGTAKQAACAFFGTVGLAWSIPVACLSPGAGLALAGASLACLDSIK